MIVAKLAFILVFFTSSFAAADESEEIKEKTPKWGDTLIKIGAAQTDFSAIEKYEILYGDAGVTAAISAHKSLYAGTFFAFSAGLGYTRYSDSGYACGEEGESCNDRSDRNLDTPLSLSINAFDLIFAADLALLPSRLFVVGLSAGYGRSIFEEVRSLKSSSSEAEADAAYSNKGLRNGMLVRADFMVRITGESSLSSGLNTDALGLRAIFLSFFYQNHQVDTPLSESGTKKMDISRDLMGASFVFELI